MATNAYHFITHWRVPGTVEEVSGILGDAPDLPRWWPSVYLAIEELESGDANGVGRVVSLYTKGWLPYTLKWQFRVTEANLPHGFSIEAWGDFVGRGIWTFEQDGSDALITYDWEIAAEKALLRRLSFLMKPVFAKNHEWAMRMGEQSLRLELERRHAVSEVERSAVPLPPGPIKFPLRKILGLGGAVGAAGVAITALRHRRT